MRHCGSQFVNVCPHLDNVLCNSVRQYYPMNKFDVPDMLTLYNLSLTRGQLD
jgi:hypothetical protein